MPKVVKQQVVIVGAGPAGLLLACYLLRRQRYRVTIYEQRADPRLTQQRSDGLRSAYEQSLGHRTFPISLQERGRQALREIMGLEDKVATQSTLCTGTVMHRASGKHRVIPRQNSTLALDRNRLVAILLAYLTEHYTPEEMTVQFDCRCVGLDSSTQTIALQNSDNAPFTISYDLLVGADGARSQVREALAAQANFPYEQTYITDAYRSIFLNRCQPGIELAADKVHTWNLANNLRMLLVPQGKDQLNGVIVFNIDQDPLATFTTKEEVLSFVQTHFPLFGQLMSLDEAEALLTRPIARVTTVHCERFHEGTHILLIGDAVHAVSAAIGQGCNAALQDVWVFDQLLNQYQDDWTQALPEFSSQRIPEAHALRELSDYSFPRHKRLVAEFIFRIQANKVLHRWFPQWVQPFLFDLIFDSDRPYSEVLHLHQGWINKVKRASQPKV